MDEEAKASLDRRQRRTRAALLAALERLIEAVPYRDIGISQLTEEADVGRPTFYRHYTDIDAVLMERLACDLEEQQLLASDLIGRGLDPRETVKTVTSLAFHRIAAKPRLYEILLSGTAGADAVVSFGRQMQQLIILLPYSTSAVRKTDPRLTLGMLTGAVTGFLLTWIEEGLTPDPDTAATLLIDLLVPAR